MKKGFIICVDDQPEIVGSLLAQLEHAVGDACEIEVAESAEEALTVLNELEEQGEQVDIVITDEIMPGMQGSHFLEIVHKKNPNIMTVILTGHAGFDDVVYAVNHAGLERCIKKPWDYEDLKQTVLLLIQKAKIKRLNERLSQELVAEKNKAEAIVHSIGDGIIVFDGDERISLVNKACLEILGCAESELIGKRVRDLRALQELIMLIAEAVNEEEEVVSDEIVIKADARHEERTIVAIAKPLQDRNERPMGVVTVLRDITTAKELNRLKANFLSTISHELRTPLTSILTTYELLLQDSLGELTEEQREFIGISKEQGEFLSELIDNLIDLTGLEAQEMELNPTMLDMAMIAREVCETASKAAQTKGLNFFMTIEPNLPKILADRPKIIRLFKNVLSNAVKFTEIGKVEFRVFRENAGIRIAVSDTGIGIDDMYFEKIFEKFFQVDNTSTREFGGSGLGLAICQAIVQAHNGRIWVESALQKGTTVHIQLPFSPTPPS